MFTINAIVIRIIEATVIIVKREKKNLKLFKMERANFLKKE